MAFISDEIKNTFSQVLSSGRMPHAVLIEGGNAALRQEAIDYLKSYAVCSSDNRPCFECNNCIKANKGGHSDIITPKSSGKTNIINMETMRSLIMDASVIPNDADTKVFILHDADTRMKEDVQNAFLKVLEEPPLSTLFILTCESSKRMLPTILSRVQVFKLKADSETSQQAKDLSVDIINGILSLTEDKLIYATAKLSTRDLFKETLVQVSEYLRKALSESVGANTDDELSYAIAKKLTKSRIIDLIDLSSKAIIRSDRNVNMTLLCTWLCGEYRRISWQR